jgi:phage terminase small subunit
MKITQKQNNFALVYVECGNAAEAYRSAYNTSSMKMQTIHRKATELMTNGTVTARITDLKDSAAKRNEITVDSLVNELENARSIAMELNNPATMVTATMGKAKLMGLDKQVIDIQSKAVTFNMDYYGNDPKMMSNDQLDERIAYLQKKLEQQ